MPIVVAMWTPSVWELGIVLLLVMVLFGAGKLPQVFGQMGRAVKNFRDAQKDTDPTDVTPAKRELTQDAVEDAHEVREKA